MIAESTKPSKATGSKADFTRRALVIRWKLEGDAYASDAEEDAAETLAAAIEPVLEQSGLAEINGFEYGPGSIDILIFGRETDAATDKIHGLIAATFESHGCPSGSCVIGVYGDPPNQREVILDAIQ